MAVASIVVRDAREEDVEQLAGLIARLKALNEELDPHFKVVDNLVEVAREYASEAVKNEKKRVIVAEDESTGEIVGLVVLSFEDRIFYVPRVKAVITDFYVLPRYRRKKVGSLLLEKALEAAAEGGAGIITVVYPAGNVIADQFYRSKKFSPFQVELYKPLK